MSTLHIHVDESGDFAFGPTGSRYYIFTAAWTYSPQALADALVSLRFALNKNGANLSRFHACDDQQVHRNLVVDVLVTHHSWWFASVVVDKRKVNPILRGAQTFYPKFLNSVLLFIFRGGMRPDTSRVLVYTDRVPSEAKKSVVTKSLQDLCGRTLTVPYHVMHHPSDSNAWLQVADYCSWAVCRKWQNGDFRTYDRLKSRLLAPEMDVLRSGTKTYY